MDFVFDRVATGRTLKYPTVVDDATHEAIAVPVEHAMGGEHLTRVLDGICFVAGQAAGDPDGQRS
jgi:putative transposase